MLEIMLGKSGDLVSVCRFIRGKPLAESKQAFSPEKVAVKTAIALGRMLVLDMVLRNEDRLVCHTLGWRGNPGNLLVTGELPHGSDKLGPPALDPKPTLGGPGNFRQRRTQSFAALSTPADSDIQSQLAKMHRAPSPELSHVGTAHPHSLQVSFYCSSNFNVNKVVILQKRRLKQCSDFEVMRCRCDVILFSVTKIKEDTNWTNRFWSSGECVLNFWSAIKVTLRSNRSR